MPDLLASIGAFLVVTALFTYISWRQKKSSWAGVVVDKKINRTSDQNGIDHESYTVIFKTETGKKIKFPVANKAGLEMFEMGKRYQKKSGSYVPEKME